MVSFFNKKEKSTNKKSINKNEYIELIQMPKIVPVPTQEFVDKMRDKKKLFFDEIKQTDFVWLLSTLKIGKRLRMPIDDKKIEIIIDISTNQSSPNEDKRCYVMVIESRSKKEIYLQRFSYDWIRCDVEKYFHGYYREFNLWKDVFDIINRYQ
jgi:hypothetical protein